MLTSAVSLTGGASVRRDGEAANLIIEGCASGARGRDVGAAVQMYFLGAIGEVPPRLSDLRLNELEDANSGSGLRLFELSAREGRFVLRAQAVQIHRDASVLFYGALPRTPLPFGVRAGWAVLLTALRIPGAMRLVSKLRGSR